jgi:hypothetical protein
VSYSVIIPSKNSANLIPCVEAIRQNEPDLPLAKIIAVDDGLDRIPEGIWVVRGDSPFVFARNCNLGIVVAGDDDVIILNDDALLQTYGGFRALSAAVHDHPDFGLISATTNNSGNPAMYAKNIGLRQEARMVTFICVYIPRTTIRAVGLLDERYIDYGMDDDDYCFSVRRAGLKLGIYDGCFVDHKSLTSSYRGGPRTGGNFLPNLARFKQKWGVDNFGRPA